MKIYKNLLLFVYFMNCFLINNAFSAMKPDWIENPTKYCKDSEICVVGFGESKELAETNARLNLLKYFSTEISSSFSSQIQADNDAVSKKVSEQIDENNQGMLKGVKIDKTYNEKNNFYVFAILNKTQKGNEIEFEIDNIDQKMKQLLFQEELKSKKELQDLFEKRQDLNIQYLFLTDKSIDDVISAEDVYNKSKNLKITTRYFININNAKIKNELIKFITANGGVISKTKNEAEKIIDGEIKIEKLSLNVEGFEKYSILFVLLLKENINGKENILSSLSEDFTETGTNMNQTVEKSTNKFMIFLEDNLYDFIK